MINTSKTVIFPYRNSRDPCASGVFWDAMKFSKPIIAPYQQPFSYYFDNYNVGRYYTSDNVKDLQKLLTEFHDIDWAVYQKNIEKMKNDFSDEEIIKRLKEIIGDTP